MFAWRVVCGSLLPILPRRPIAINSRPATDFFLAYNSFLPFLACVAWLLLLCYCCFLCTHFSCWRWCTDLCVSFIANPPPRRPIAINSRPATDFFLAYNSFLPFLACVAWLLLLCYCCFLCTHFSCWRWCTDLCVSFIANPPPRRPIAINSRPATDCFEISDLRYSLRCKAKKYI